MGIEKHFEEMERNPQKIGAIEAVKEGALAVAPGLKNFMDDLKELGQNKLAHGAHELAASLYGPGHSAFVMYARDGKEREGKEEGHGVHGPETKAPETPQQENQNERGGRSR